MATYCSLPNFHLQIKPNGIVKPCCRFDVEEAKKMQPENKNGLQAIHSQSWELLREQMASQNVPSGCHKCAAEEALGLISMRTSEAQALKKFSVSANQVRLCDLEIGFGNVCNLSCRTCSSHLSTKWYDDDVYLNENLSFFRKVAKQRKVDVQIDFDDDEIFKGLQSVKFTGGEPFLHKNFPLFLKALLSTGGAERTALRICTNASFFPSKEIIEVLSRFKTVDISVSIDGYGSYNDYLRFPSVWSETQEALARWSEVIQKSNHWTMTLCSTISAYSLVGVNDLMNWWRDFTASLSHEKFRLIHQPVFDPFYLAPSILPLEIVKKFPLKDSSASKYFNGKTANKENLEKFCEFTQKLDRRRGENFDDIFSELSLEIKRFLNQEGSAMEFYGK